VVSVSNKLRRSTLLQGLYHKLEIKLYVLSN